MFPPNRVLVPSHKIQEVPSYCFPYDYAAVCKGLLSLDILHLPPICIPFSISIDFTMTLVADVSNDLFIVQQIKLVYSPAVTQPLKTNDTHFSTQMLSTKRYIVHRKHFVPTPTRLALIIMCSTHIIEEISFCLPLFNFVPDGHF